MTFSDFTSQYPHPQNRGDMVRAKARLDRIVQAGQAGSLMEALVEYRQYLFVNKWCHPAQMSTWLGSANNERWREFLKEAPKTVTPLLDAALNEERILQRAEGIRTEQVKRQKWWDLDSAKHAHSDRCQKGCMYEPEKRPAVREIDFIIAQIRSEAR